MPAAARQHTVAGAEAFTRFYFDMANYAQHTLAVDSFAALADENCASCDGGVDQLRSIAKQRGTIRGGDTQLSRLTVRPSKVSGETFMLVRFHYHLTPMYTDYPGVRRDRSYKAVDGQSYVVVKRTETGWLVDYWDA